MFKNNIIDLNRRLKTKNNSVQPNKQPQKKAKAEVSAPVLDMTERRTAILNDERREVRRTILTGFIGAFVVIPMRADGTGGLLKVDIYDISDNGIAFDISEQHGHFQKGEEIAMRVYLSQDTYFPFIVKIQNQRQLSGEPIYRHGANFIKGTVNDEALFHFVKFIETVSASLERDSGDVMVSGLKK
jgi:PilZ domain